VSDQIRVAMAVALYTYHLYEIPLTAAVHDALSVSAFFYGAQGHKNVEHFGLLSRWVQTT